MKKIIATILLVSFVCILFAGCKTSKKDTSQYPGAVITTDEDAIKQVVMKALETEGTMDIDTYLKCLAPEFPSDQRPSADYVEQQLAKMVEQGILVQEDTQKYMQMQREYGKKTMDMVKYTKWDITITDENTAIVIVTMDIPDLDYGKLIGDTQNIMGFRESLFRQVCGMDEETAKSSLTPQEFSTTYLEVDKLYYDACFANIVRREDMVGIRLTKQDDVWYIAEYLSQQYN